MKVFFRRRSGKQVEDEGLAAKIEAEIQHKIALTELHEATQKSEVIHDMNTRNHFSQGLERAFRARPL